MRVKRLEIQGFKSFKDKTVVHFDHGITGIVGPNGCGKSNIVDAFFWVMGEQSYKHMRGSSSDDLIFNGSSKYSPLGMAEATLVMELDPVFVDDELSSSSRSTAGEEPKARATASVAALPVQLRGKEVSVTRRLYRAGEGEYFINGIQARLRDIQELFMDTGVGAKGYSVIEQGQIGRIVQAKPEERRLLVEEAAGIAKYKARKKESLRKMEQTQANLSRLNDVVVEIERNLGSLERQAQKARQYRKYREELLEKEMTWGRRKIRFLRDRQDALKRKREALEQDLVGLRAELQVAENQIEVDRVEQLTDTKLAEEQQTLISRHSDELTHEKSALDLSKRRQSDLTSQLEALETEKAGLTESLEVEHERLETRAEEADQAQLSFQEASNQALELDKQVRALRQEAETLRKQVESSKRDLLSGISNSSSLASRAAALLGRMEAAEAQAQGLDQQLEEQEARLGQAREEAERAVESAAGIQGSILTLRGRRLDEQAGVQAQEPSLRQLEKEREQSLRSLTQLKSRLQSLEELSQSHEGFGDGPKAALDWAKAKGHKGKFFSLADALEVGAGFESALEGWLESRLESLITAEAAAAADAIEQVRSVKQGRVAIQLANAAEAPLALGATESQATAALKAAGFDVKGELAALVKLNRKLEPSLQELASRTIARVLVVASFEPMAAFLENGKAAKIKGWAVASLEGSALSADGTLRGGQMKNDGGASLLRRKNVIAELTEQAGKADTEHQARETTIAQAREALEASRARLQGIQNELQAQEVQAAAVERDVHQMARAVKDAERQLESLRSQRGHASHETERAARERELIEGELSRFNAVRTELDEKIAAGDEALATKDDGLRGLESELSTLRVNEASLRERAGSRAIELEASKALITDRERRLTEINRTLERVSRDQQQFTGGEGHIEERIEELTRTLAEAREALAKIKDRIEKNSSKSNSGMDRIKQLHKRGDQQSSESTQLAIDLEKVTSEIAHLVQNLEEKYGPGCLEAEVAPAPTADEIAASPVEMTPEEELALGEEVERLRERIRRLGEVNVMAIEEYEELKKRYDYLLTEKLDLERSIENLKEAIEHINRTSIERFKKAYEAIADRFERLFPIIFGGGQARLSLVYPEGVTDILEAGVDILAQPPGKKVVNIGLLSGGEKALTACSLIFAIFLVKPSPFCILDEVDAPLDDANIGKFNALLREMSSKSQFILITHNKKTMELNDTLYGVTMEEPGVSKMVSIQMH